MVDFFFCFYLLNPLQKLKVKEITSSVAKWVPLIMILWPFPCPYQGWTLTGAWSTEATRFLAGLTHLKI